MIEYRKEIDGLRAIAVLPVMLFHGGFETFSGGYVGVDVFFVISGYLITLIILHEIKADKFSIIDFYERRIRRILPALLFVATASMPFAWLWLSPKDLKDFSQSIVAVSLFASNILFWLESGYFDSVAELKPLLHTWSLAVEGQFYLIFPIFIALTWKCGLRRITIIVMVVASISLALAHWGALMKPAATFYLLPTRAWELLIGSLLALQNERRPSVKIHYASELASFLGLILIIYAVFAFDKTTLFPGMYALVPTIGAALIIAFATPITLVGRVLASVVLRFSLNQVADWHE